MKRNGTIVLLIPVLLAMVSAKCMSQSCVNPGVSGQAGWQQGGSLTINIDPAFGDNTGAVENALDAWFKNNAINSSMSVTYTHNN